MTQTILLRPGQMRLAEWRAVYRGAPVTLDPIARADVEAGAATLRKLLDDKGKAARSGRGSPTVSDLLQRGGDPLPSGLVRLLIALKIASIGQGVTGAGWPLVEGLAECLSRDLLPAIQARQISDRLALTHIFAVLTGTGEVLGPNRRHSAAKALKKAGLMPLKLSPPEKQALLSGNTLSTAFALAGLFEAERVFQSALIAGAMTHAALPQPGPIPHPRVDRFSRHAGQSEVAQVFRALLGGQTGAALLKPAADPTESRRFAAQMGACLDVLRHAGATLARTANAPSEDQLVFWQTEELAAGLEDSTAITFAADQIALALRELGQFSERRIAALSGVSDSDSNSGTIRHVAAGFASEIRDRALPASFETDVESDYPLVSAPAAPRILRVAGATSLVVVVELLAAANLSERNAASAATEPLSRVRSLLREAAAQLPEDHGVSPAALAGAAELVRSGQLASSVRLELPSVTLPEPAGLA